MTGEILRKLRAHLNSGISTEAQVVYVLAGIRKLIERDNLTADYRTLKFHCDWALHASLDRGHAKAILSQWDAAHPLFKNGMKLSDMPADIRSEIVTISQMRVFKKELETFLQKHHLPSLERRRPDGWVHFLHLYSQVVADIQLVVKAAGAQHIAQVSVRFERAKKRLPNGEVLFKVSWNIEDQNGGTGEYFVINSYTGRRPPMQSPARKRKRPQSRRPVRRKTSPER